MLKWRMSLYRDALTVLFSNARCGIVFGRRSLLSRVVVAAYCGVDVTGGHGYGQRWISRRALGARSQLTIQTSPPPRR